MPARIAVTRPQDFIPFEKESIKQGIHQRFEEQAHAFRAKAAIHEDDAELSYGELNGRANSIAQAILSLCGANLAQTALLLPNSATLIASMLGSLKARKAYVPLDCNYPVERLRMMLDDAEASVLVTDDRHRELAERLAGRGISILNLSDAALDPDAPDPRLATDPFDRAYILYTSGTTGRPKGIEFLHRNLLHTTMCLTNELFFSPSDRVTWLHSPSFGSSVVDIYCCLTNGATLYPWDVKSRGFHGMTEWLIRGRLTTLQWIPSAFRQWMRTVPAESGFPDLRIAVMAGEPLTVREVELFRRHFTAGSHLVNQVGTAESYNYHLYAVDHELAIEGVNVPGGYPVSPDRQVLILNEAHEPQPRGATGEIAIKGNYMSAGYWRNDSETRAKFIHVGNDDVPVYLTGDMGTLAADDCLTHLGRRDFQVKIRGCRVEIAEVEQMLACVPGVADCACWIAKNRSSEEQLVGYVVAKVAEQFSQNDARKFLEEKLPGGMVPHSYVVLDALPYLPSGKIDRKALPNPFASASALDDVDAAEFSSELWKIQEIFREVLEVDCVSADSDFLNEGGDSLSIAVLQHRLGVSFGVEIAMDEFSGSLTPARVASLIGRAPRQRPGESSAEQPSSALTKSSATSQPSALRNANVRTGAAKPSRTTNTFSVKPPSAGKKDLVIISAGRMGREVFTWASHAIAAGANYRIKGFLDDRADMLAGGEYGPGILGNVNDYEIEENDVFVCAVGDPHAKAAYYTPILERGGQFINVIHPAAVIGSHVQLGNGIVLAPYVVLTADITIGDHVAVGTFSNISHDVTIGSWCQIGSHCGVNGCASLGEGAFLGSHVCVAPEISVGAWAFAGAGSVVVRHVPAGAKVFGNPATVIGSHSTERHWDEAMARIA